MSTRAGGSPRTGAARQIETAMDQKRQPNSNRAQHMRALMLEDQSKSTEMSGYRSVRRR